MQDHHHVAAMRTVLAILRVVAIAACVGVLVPALALAAPPAPTQATAACDAIHGLTVVSREHRDALHQACVQGPSADAGLYSAIVRLVSSSGWHAGMVGTILRRHGQPSLTAWAEGGTHPLPPALVAQQHIDAGLAGFASSTQCAELRRSAELTAFLEAVAADESPEVSPFTSRFAACLGVPVAAMEGTRLLTIRADGLDDVTMVVGTRDFVHARRWSRAEALRLGDHRFFVVAVPEGSPVVVLGTHEHHALPMVWRGSVARNTVIWAAPPRRSCLELSVRMNAGTQLYLDGVRIDDGVEEAICAGAGAEQTAVLTVDRTLPITFDLPASGLPPHELTALTCEGKGKARRPVVRHLSPLAATAPAERLRPVGQCEALRLDLDAPAAPRVAVLGVTKLPGCEATPMWASDLQEGVRHVLGRDMAHQGARSYVNFSAYAEASEALLTLESRVSGQGRDAPERGPDANTLIGSAAQEAWRQGIDTLLSLAVQCTPRGANEHGEPQWSYSVRATAIDIRELFARGYHDRDGLDLEGFIDVQSVAFEAAEQQDASLGMLLDRVFAVAAPRFAHPPTRAPYRQPQPLRLGGFATNDVPETIAVRVRPLDRLGQGMLRPRDRKAAEHERRRSCDELLHRGARSLEALEIVRTEYPRLPGKERPVELQRSRDPADASSDPRATMHGGEVTLPHPGWYMVTVDADENGSIDDAVCVQGTYHRLDLWTDMVLSGGPLAHAKNGSRAKLYLRPRVGWTRYLTGGWLGLGLGFGYGFTDYAGTRADWADLGVGAKDRLRWRRHALLVSPYLEARSRSTALPVEFRARLGAALDTAVVDIRRIDPDLVDFRAGHDEDAILDADLDLNLDLSVGPSFGPVQLEALMMLAYVAVDDPFARAATTVTQDAGFYVGFGFVISGGRR